MISSVQVNVNTDIRIKSEQLDFFLQCDGYSYLRHEKMFMWKKFLDEQKKTCF